MLALVEGNKGVFERLLLYLASLALRPDVQSNSVLNDNFLRDKLKLLALFTKLLANSSQSANIANAAFRFQLVSNQ